MIRNFYSVVQALAGLRGPQCDEPLHHAHGAGHASPALQDGPEIGKKILLLIKITSLDEVLVS